MTPKMGLLIIAAAHNVITFFTLLDVEKSFSAITLWAAYSSGGSNREKLSLVTTRDIAQSLVNMTECNTKANTPSGVRSITIL